MIKMLPFLVSLLLATAAASLNFKPQKSAATAAQIRFAIENNYDDTGPGAKGAEYAYNTYKTLDDALVGYLDDPDTKLPDHERAKALNKLYKTNSYIAKLFSPPFSKPANSQGTYVVYQDRPSVLTNEVGTKMLNSYEEDPFSWRKFQAVKSSPLNLAYYSRISEPFDPHPQYSFSYGVHDQGTGDLKQAHETRNGNGLVLGYYSFREPDGKQRTVHYTSDDTHGFRAAVKRSFENNQ